MLRTVSTNEDRNYEKGRRLEAFPSTPARFIMLPKSAPALSKEGKKKTVEQKEEGEKTNKKKLQHCERVRKGSKRAKDINLLSLLPCSFHLSSDDMRT
jgi:hypothetical protein